LAVRCSVLDDRLIGIPSIYPVLAFRPMERFISVLINQTLIKSENLRLLSPSAHYMASLIALGHFLPDPHSLFSRARIWPLPPPMDSQCLISLELQPGLSKELTCMQLRVKGASIVELVTVGPVPADLSLLGKQTVFAQRCPSAIAFDGFTPRSVRILVPSAELPALLSFSRLMDNERLRFRCSVPSGSQVELYARDFPARPDSPSSGRSSPMSLSGLKTPRSESPKMYVASEEHPPLLPLQAFEPAEPSSSLRLPVVQPPPPLTNPAAAPPAVSLVLPQSHRPLELKRTAPQAQPLSLGPRPSSADASVQTESCQHCGIVLVSGPSGSPPRLLCPPEQSLACRQRQVGPTLSQLSRQQGYEHQQSQLRCAQARAARAGRPDPDWDKSQEPRYMSEQWHQWFGEKPDVVPR